MLRARAAEEVALSLAAPCRWSAHLVPSRGVLEEVGAQEAIELAMPPAEGEGQFEEGLYGHGIASSMAS